MQTNKMVDMLKQLIDEVLNLEAEAENAKKDIPDVNVKRVLRIAKNYPIRNHVLTKLGQEVRDRYVTFLVSLFYENKDEVSRIQQMVFVYRIIASYDQDIEVNEYVVRSLKIDEKFLDDLLELLDKETRLCLAVDMMIVTLFEAEDGRRKNLELISDMFQLFQMDKREMGKAAARAKAIMEQDFDQMLQQISPENKMDYNFLGYFESLNYSNMTNDLFAARIMEGKIAIINAEVTKCDEVIDLDGYAAKEIDFIGCRFQNIQGIKNSKIKVKFNKCAFENDAFNVNTENNAANLNPEDLFSALLVKYGSENYRKDYGFILGCNMQFINSKFINCMVSECLINLEHGEMNSCEIIECKGNNVPCTYLIQIENGNIINCKFNDCFIETDESDRMTTTVGLVYIKNGKVDTCTFDRCEVKGNSGYGRFAQYKMQIVRAVDSKVLNCGFHKCCCSSCDSSKKIVESYILGITNSSEKNNEFGDCSSYHYQYSDRGASYNVGEI